jgi:signal transduction histidine kinase
MALAELEAGAPDPARRADLELLLRLASRELAQVVARAGDGADQVLRHTESIQRTLAHQLRPPGAGPVIETAELATVVERGVQMVAPAMQQRLRIQLDGSVAAIGAVPLPRVLLQQVVQNLVLNAAESVRDAGRERGHLLVTGRVEHVDDGERLVLRFTDDGGGIAAECLERVFEKGYSTKSRETNLGIGLHWCANAVTALGGAMRAESPGPGQGATLQVMLPLRRSGAGSVREAA